MAASAPRSAEPGRAARSTGISLLVSKLTLKRPTVVHANEALAPRASLIMHGPPIRILHGDILRDSTHAPRHPTVTTNGGCVEFVDYRRPDGHIEQVAVKWVVGVTSEDDTRNVWREAKLHNNFFAIDKLDEIGCILPIRGVVIAPNARYPYDEDVKDIGIVTPRMSCDLYDAIHVRKDVQEWPVSEKLKVWLHVAKAVNLLHAHPDRPCVHADIKTKNIFLDADHRPYLGDFGAARWKKASPSTSTWRAECTTSAILPHEYGTWRYLAPELAALQQPGSWSEANFEVRMTPATDVYALGAVLYELLEERKPHYEHEDEAGIRSPLALSDACESRLGPQAPDIRSLFNACCATDPAARSLISKVSEQGHDILRRMSVLPLAHAVHCRGVAMVQDPAISSFLSRVDRYVDDHDVLFEHVVQPRVLTTTALVNGLAVLRNKLRTSEHCADIIVAYVAHCLDTPSATPKRLRVLISMLQPGEDNIRAALRAECVRRCDDHPPPSHLIPLFTLCASSGACGDPACIAMMQSEAATVAVHPDIDQRGTAVADFLTSELGSALCAHVTAGQACGCGAALDSIVSAFPMEHLEARTGSVVPWSKMMTAIPAPISAAFMRIVLRRMHAIVPYNVQGGDVLCPAIVRCLMACGPSAFVIHASWAVTADDLVSHAEWLACNNGFVHNSSRLEDLHELVGEYFPAVVAYAEGSLKTVRPSDPNQQRAVRLFLRIIGVGDDGTSVGLSAAVTGTGAHSLDSDAHSAAPIKEESRKRNRSLFRSSTAR